MGEEGKRFGVVQGEGMDESESSSNNNIGCNEDNTATRSNSSHSDVQQQMKYDPQVFMSSVSSFSFNRTPCAKEAFMQGGLAGFAVGIVRLMRTKYIATSIKWGVGAFMVSTVASMEYCRQSRANRLAKLREANEKIHQYHEQHDGDLPYHQDKM
eukprot:m.240899 g.240899  ORF g.240899 m.240899 type:complete len:155 (+) comp16389_c0_seq1:132-596(+)